MIWNNLVGPSECLFSLLSVGCISAGSFLWSYEKFVSLVFAKVAGYFYLRPIKAFYSDEISGQEIGIPNRGERLYPPLCSLGVALCPEKLKGQKNVNQETWESIFMVAEFVGLAGSTFCVQESK